MESVKYGEKKDDITVNRWQRRVEKSRTVSEQDENRVGAKRGRKKIWIRLKKGLKFTLGNRLSRTDKKITSPSKKEKRKKKDPNITQRRINYLSLRTVVDGQSL